MNFLKKIMKTSAEKIYKYFGDNSGKMLLATSMIGISMSSAMQALAVLFNDKYTPSQKAFMIPQELSDALVSIISIFAISKPIQTFSAQLIRTGKILPKSLVSYLHTNKLLEKRGKANFNLQNEIQNIICKIENSDKFIKSAQKDKDTALLTHKQALENYNSFQDATSAYATTMASLVSTCLVVPIIRNNTASKYQKKRLNYISHPIMTSPSPYKVY